VPTAARLGGLVLAAATVAGCGSSTAAGAGRPSVPDQVPATPATPAVAAHTPAASRPGYSGSEHDRYRILRRNRRRAIKLAGGRVGGRVRFRAPVSWAARARRHVGVRRWNAIFSSG